MKVGFLELFNLPQNIYRFLCIGVYQRRSCITPRQVADFDDLLTLLLSNLHADVQRELDTLREIISNEIY